MSDDAVTRQATQRVFFATWPDASCASQLAELAVDVAAAARGRASTPDRLHLTLAFIGEVAAPRVAQLIAIGAEVAAGVAPFPLAWHRLGYFRNAGVAWLGADEVPHALLSLVEALHSRLAGAAFPVDARPYQPHLTLARRCRSRPIGIAVRPLAWEARAITLHASKLSREGPRYSELGRWNFGRTTG